MYKKSVVKEARQHQSTKTNIVRARLLGQELYNLFTAIL